MLGELLDCLCVKAEMAAGSSHLCSHSLLISYGSVSFVSADLEFSKCFDHLSQVYGQFESHASMEVEDVENGALPNPFAPELQASLSLNLHENLPHYTLPRCRCHQLASSTFPYSSCLPSSRSLRCLELLSLCLLVSHTNGSCPTCLGSTVCSRQLFVCMD